MAPIGRAFRRGTWVGLLLCVTSGCIPFHPGAGVHVGTNLRGQPFAEFEGTGPHFGVQTGASRAVFGGLMVLGGYDAGQKSGVAGLRPFVAYHWTRGYRPGAVLELSVPLRTAFEGPLKETGLQGALELRAGWLVPFHLSDDRDALRADTAVLGFSLRRTLWPAGRPELEGLGGWQLGLAASYRWLYHPKPSARSN